MSPRTVRQSLRYALVVPLGLVAACDIPSDPPILQQTWIIPADSITVGVAEILPANVALNAGGTAFVVNVAAPAAINSTLGVLCGDPACQSPTTVTAPVPAFTSGAGALGTTVSFPSGVNAATVTSGSLNLSVNNTLGFNPLRPNGTSAPFGSIAITLTSGSTTSTTTFTGATSSLPTGATTVLNVPLPTGVYTGTISVAAVLNVPAGGNGSLNSANALSIGSAVQSLTVSQATVVVNADAINTSPTEFDLEGVDFGDQVESGGLILDVNNGLTASANMSVAISAPAQNGSAAVTVTKALVIPATATSSSTISLSKAELQSLLGKANVTITVTGTATGSGAGNTVVVTPTQRITLRTRVRLVLNVGA